MNPQLSPKAIREIREGTCNPLGAPQVTTDLSENIILTSLDDLHNWARLSSLWPLLYGTACCFIEFAALIGSRFVNSCRNSNDEDGSSPSQTL